MKLSPRSSLHHDPDDTTPLSQSAFADWRNISHALPPLPPYQPSASPSTPTISRTLTPLSTPSRPQRHPDLFHATLTSSPSTPNTSLQATRPLSSRATPSRPTIEIPAAYARVLRRLGWNPELPGNWETLQVLYERLTENEPDNWAEIISDTLSLPGNKVWELIEVFTSDNTFM